MSCAASQPTRTAAWVSLHPVCLYCDKSEETWCQKNGIGAGLFRCHTVFEKKSERFHVSLLLFHVSDKRFRCEVSLRQLSYHVDVIRDGHGKEHTYFWGIIQQSPFSTPRVKINSIEQYRGLLHIRQRLRKRVYKRRCTELLAGTSHFYERGICSLISEYI